MKKFSYNGVAFDFLYTFDDLEAVANYDKAEKKLNEVLNSQADNTDMAERMATCCEAMAVYIDDVLGDGSCNRLFGEEVKATEIMKCKNTLIQYVAMRMNEENTAVEIKDNRATRRAKK